MRRLLAIVGLVVGIFNSQCAAEEVVSALSQNRVSITALYDGSEIFVYGAIKREAPPSDDPVDVIITVAGPLEPVVVRRKKRVFGIWANVDAVEIDHAPSFYTVASSAPLGEILTEVADLTHKVTIERLIRSVGAPSNIFDAPSFSEALIRIRQDMGLYSVVSESLSIAERSLFGTRVSLPANLVEGNYTTRVFLVRDGKVINETSNMILVQKVGLERWIYTLAHEKPLVYGILAVFLAVFTGWAASLMFRRFV